MFALKEANQSVHYCVNAFERTRHMCSKFVLLPFNIFWSEKNATITCKQINVINFPIWKYAIYYYRYFKWWRKTVSVVGYRTKVKKISCSEIGKSGERWKKLNKERMKKSSLNMNEQKMTSSSEIIGFLLYTIFFLFMVEQYLF